MATSWIDAIGSQLRDLGAVFWSGVRDRGVATFLQPVAPYDRPGFMSPVVTLGGVLGILLFSGMAVTAMGALVVALLGLYLLLAQVFGLQLEFTPFGPFGR